MKRGKIPRLDPDTDIDWEEGDEPSDLPPPKTSKKKGKEPELKPKISLWRPARSLSSKD